MKLQASNSTMGDLYKALRPSEGGYKVTYDSGGKDGDPCVKLRKGDKGYDVYMADHQKPLFSVYEFDDEKSKSLGNDFTIEDLDQLIKTGKRVKAAVQLNAAIRLAAVENEDVVQISIKKDPNNTLVLRTDGKFVELTSDRASFTLDTIMFNRPDLNGSEDKVNAVRSVVQRAYRLSDGKGVMSKTQDVISALVRVTKLPRHMFNSF